MKTRSSPRNAQRGAASTWIFAGFALVALYFLLTEHRAHLYGWLPYLLLAACPLMHLFHGHGGHGSHGADDEPRRSDELPPTVNPSQSNTSAPPVAHHHH